MRKELCRNFQRGSCQYGARCKFMHASSQQQQQQQSNPFGFGSQQPQQQQKPNPFGFGVQSGSQHPGSNRPNQTKPFENKWSRFSPIPSAGASSGQTGGKPQQADHKCTDPEGCKRIIQEDFKNEKPLWKFTSYGHWRYLPCDIVGDMSYEEMRATAYDEAKRGASLQSIIERERNMVNSKLAEFESFLHSPYKGPGNAVITSQSIFQQSGQMSAPSAFPGIVQQNAFPNANILSGPALPPQSSPGPPSSFANLNQPSNPFGINTPQSIPSGSPFTSKPAAFTDPNISQSNQFFPSNISQSQTPLSLNAFNASPETDTTKKSAGMGPQREAGSGDNSIWLKAKWSPGEIPEQAPPDAFV